MFRVYYHSSVRLEIQISTENTAWINLLWPRSPGGWRSGLDKSILINIFYFM